MILLQKTETLVYTADDAFAVAHDWDCIADHVMHGDAQQFLRFPRVPQTDVLRRTRRHQVTAFAAYNTVRHGIHDVYLNEPAKSKRVN